MLIFAAMKKDPVEKDQKLNSSDVDHCIHVLELLLENSEALAHLSEEKRIALMKAAGKLTRPDRHELKKRNKSVEKVKKKSIVINDRKARAKAGIRVARIATVFEAPKMIGEKPTGKKVLSSPRNCYVCKKEFTEVHHFYDAMCPECGDFNYSKRFQTSDLTGQVALITGSRLKIGYQSTLMMLRAGATVIATTRFPADSAIRFAKEEDFKEWGHRLKIHGLDLRHIPSVELFATFIENTYDRLDILINNAAQTVRRPSGFYAHLIPNEEKPYEKHSEEVKMLLEDHFNLSEDLRAFNKKNINANLPVSWHGK